MSNASGGLFLKRTGIVVGIVPAIGDYGIGQQAMHKPCGWKNVNEMLAKMFSPEEKKH